MTRAILGIATLILALAGPATADPDHAFRVGDIAIEQPRSRATPGRARNGAAYLTLNNHGEATDRLSTAATPVAERAELHVHRTEDGIMKMRPVEAIEVVPGSPTVLAPGGLHIMLVGLKEPIEEGQRFPLTLTFERNGEVTVEVKVGKVGAKEPGHGHHHGGGAS